MTEAQLLKVLYEVAEELQRRNQQDGGANRRLAEKIADEDPNLEGTIVVAMIHAGQEALLG